MNLKEELRKNDGQFDIGHFIENEKAYIRVIKSLLKRKEYPLLCKILDCYYRGFRSYGDTPLMSYRPGYDYIISYYPFFIYAQLCEKGIKGVLKRDKEKSGYSYLQLLKRIDSVPSYISSYLYKNNKIDLLLHCAYPDLMDRYSVALHTAGMHYYRLKDYKTAFKLFKKGADFKDSGRQIAYPYYLMSKNQSMVADMYLKGQGVEKDEDKAIEYYKKSAENVGKKEHRRMGDIYLKHKEYASAFLAYTEVNEHWPWQYSTFFMHPNGLPGKYKRIYKHLNEKQNRDEIETAVLVIMLRTGLGCEENQERAKELLPEQPEWIDRWVHRCDQVLMY